MILPFYMNADSFAPQRSFPLWFLSACSFLSVATRILDRTRTKFTEGLASSFDLTQAQNQRVSAQGSLTQATLRWLNAHLRLQRSLNA